MNNSFRDNLRKAFNEGFSVADIYGAGRETFKPKILKEIDPNTSDDAGEADLDLNDPTEDETGQTTGQNDASPEGDDAVSDVPEGVSDDKSETDEPDKKQDTNEPKKRPVPDEITPPAPIVPIETPEQKVQRMYTDTGDVDYDYSNTNENNIRLATFKFDNAGIVLDKILTEDDLAGGISSKDIENRLTPDQADLYRTKNIELRKKYPLIDKREKMCLIHNAHVPMTKRDEQYNEVKIDNNQRKQGYDKLNAYMEKHFSTYWQDKPKYVNFLKTIKVNFSDKPAIRANLINSKKFIHEDSADIIPLDKVYAQIPKKIQELLLDNGDDPAFVKSNIFRTLNSSFNQEIASSGSMYVIINSENIKLGDENDSDNDGIPDEDQEKEDESGDEPGIDTDEPAAEGEPEGTDEPDLEAPPAEGEEGLEPVGTDVEI